MAGMLAMCVGLTACGGNNASSSSSASTSSSSSTASSSAAASTVTATDAVLYWEGTLGDGQVVDYAADLLNGLASLSVAKSDFSDGAVWFGPASVSADGVVTITDAETNHPIKFTLVSANENAVNIDIENYGAVELKPITESEFKAYVEKFAASPEGKKLKKEIKREVKKLEEKVAKRAEKLMSEIESLDDDTIFFWDGKLSNGMSVSYMDNPKGTKAYLAIMKADLSDGAVWYGKTSTSEANKMTTITDSETNQTISYQITESSDSSMKMVIEGAAEVELKPVTKADFMKFVEELSKLTDKSASK